MANKRRKGRRRPSRAPLPRPQRRPVNPDVDGGETPGSKVGEGKGGSEVLLRQWKAGRTGAWSGRGYHFQATVGAWLAARMASGRDGGIVLIPEGLEDMSLEGARPRHVQIKSRGDHLGRFPVGKASEHVLKVWQKHLERPDDDALLVIVFERGVDGENDLIDLNQCLTDSLEKGSGLGAALHRLAEKLGISSGDVSSLFSSTVVLGLTWDEVKAATATEIASLVSLPPSALRLVADRLRIVVANASDANASRHYQDPHGISRTEVVSNIQRVAEQIDVESLEFAVAEGICEPLNYGESSIGDDRFYEGVATQPGHVAAGLVVPNPDVMDAIMSGLDDRANVVITGPSGVGKSAVLWTVPLGRPDVVWYRIRRLSPEDTPHLIRLARSHQATTEKPVGFLIDAAGTEGFDGWTRLRSELSSVSGILLVATARAEDIFILGDLTGCATVKVQLDETAAATIFDGLKRRGATTAAHWAEALASSKGLTLEFTHLLIRGQRLDELVGEQVRRRLAENRFLELEVMRLVSVADRWSASISSQDLPSACGTTEWEIYRAIERLIEEHLIVAKDGAITGLHPLRSLAISNAIHTRLPPDITVTIKEVITLIPDHQVHRFVANLLRDLPSAARDLNQAVMADNPTLGWLAGYLHGVRLSDFYETAKMWRDLAQERKVPASCQPLLFNFTALGIPIPDDLLSDLTPVQLELQEVKGPMFREEMINMLGEDAIARLLVSATDITLATQMLAVLDMGTPALAVALSGALSDDPPLSQVLKDAPIPQIAELIAAARSCHVSCAQVLLDVAGGQERVLGRIREANPWITELDVRIDKDNKRIAFARILHVSDTLQTDAQEAAVALGQLLLRCLPHIESVDIQAVVPGGYEMRIHDYTHGITQLQRQYDVPVSGIAWNQARMRAALTLLSEADTSRLTQALPLLEEAAVLTHELGTLFVTGKLDKISQEEFAQRMGELHKKAGSLKPSLGTVEVGDTGIFEETQTPIGDDLSALVIDLTGNVYKRLANPEQHPALAAYLANTVLGRHLQGALNEPWVLLGMDRHPKSLDRLQSVWSDIYAVVNEYASERSDIGAILNSARSGRRDQALHRAAQTSRRQERLRLQARRATVQRLCRATGLRIHVLHPQMDRATLLEFAITVELETLMEWPDALSILAELLGSNRPRNETYVFLPLRNGRPIPSLAMKLGMTLYPPTDINYWSTVSPDPWPSDLADTFSHAVSALQVLSGLCHLPEAQQSHDLVQRTAEEAVRQFNAVQKSLLEIPSDSLVDALVALLEEVKIQVLAELDGRHPGIGFADQSYAGLYEVRETEEFNAVIRARLLALEWQIDPESAIALLPPDSEPTPSD